LYVAIIATEFAYRFLSNHCYEAMLEELHEISLKIDICMKGEIECMKGELLHMKTTTYMLMSGDRIKT